jgi:plasmid maintenance system killer protein
MPEIHFDPRFDVAYRKFTKHDLKRVQAVDRVLKIFVDNPTHPSLHLEKLSGSDIRSIRVDRGNRLFFVWEDGVAIFFFVGPHDSYRTLRR